MSYDKNDYIDNLNVKMINILIITSLIAISKIFINNPITLFGMFIFQTIILTYIILSFIYYGIKDIKYMIIPFIDFINSPYTHIVIYDSKRRKAVYHYIRCRLHLLRIAMTKEIKNKKIGV